MAKAKKKSNKVLWILVVGILVILVAAIGAKKAGLIGQPKTLKVQLANAERTTIVEKVTASGVVQPVTEIILSPDVAGEIIELNVEEGDFVNEGVVLAKIRPDNFISALDRTKANLNQQKANLASSKVSVARNNAQLTQAKLAFDRSKKLKDQNVISESDFEGAKANYEVAVQNLEAAKESVKAGEYIVKSSEATVKEAEENVRLTVMEAPASGTISKLNVLKGERVVGTQQMAGTEMMRIADLTKMEVRVDVNENDIIRVSEGDTTIIDVDSYTYMDRSFQGVVTAIANTANPKASADAVTEFEVKIRILNGSFEDLLSEIKGASPFRPGMTASVEIITNTKTNVLSVPLSAVTTRTPSQLKKFNPDGDEEENMATSVNTKDEDIKEVVFIKDGLKAKMVEVKTGISDYDNIEILEGLSEGDIVISGPFFVVSKRIREGDLIEENSKSKIVSSSSN
jgi:HlyD family secretion protein